MEDYSDMLLLSLFLYLDDDDDDYLYIAMMLAEEIDNMQTMPRHVREPIERR